MNSNLGSSSRDQLVDAKGKRQAPSEEVCKLVARRSLRIATQRRAQTHPDPAGRRAQGRGDPGRGGEAFSFNRQVPSGETAGPPLGARQASREAMPVQALPRRQCDCGPPKGDLEGGHTRWQPSDVDDPCSGRRPPGEVPTDRATSPPIVIAPTACATLAVIGDSPFLLTLEPRRSPLTCGQRKKRGDESSHIALHAAYSPRGAESKLGVASLGTNQSFRDEAERVPDRWCHTCVTRRA